MLVLSRKLGEKIMIGDRIVVTVVKLGHGQVRLGFVAPRGRRGLPRGDHSSPHPPAATDRLSGYAKDRALVPEGTEACHRFERGTALTSWVRAPAIAYEDESHPLPDHACH